MTYSEIRETTKVSKSTLSLWLRKYPLSKERLKDRYGNEVRIEKTRYTKQRKREARHKDVLARVGNQIGTLSSNELFVAGLVLYWAEGTKANRDTICITNTDPAMIRFFLEWLKLVGIGIEKVKIKLHLYQDMDADSETLFWMEALGLPRTQFVKPYVKSTNFLKRRNYKGRFGHDTCNVFVYGRDVYERTMLGTDHIRSLYGGLPMQI